MSINDMGQDKPPADPAMIKIKKDELKQKASAAVREVLKENMIAGKFGTDWLPKDFLENPTLRAELRQIIVSKYPKFPTEMLQSILTDLNNKRTIV